MSRAADILAEVGGILTGRHVVYTSGRHGSAYVNKDAVYPHTERVAELCELLAESVRGLAAEVVCGPALGGIILSQWTAHSLGALAVFAEKLPAGGLGLRRGYDRLVAGRRVVVVEDVLNTGGSVRDTVAAVRAAGGELVAVAALCNRGGLTAGGSRRPASACADGAVARVVGRGVVSALSRRRSRRHGRRQGAGVPGRPGCREACRMITKHTDTRSWEHTQPLRARDRVRAKAVDAIPWWYSPWGHLAFPSLVGLGLIASALSMLHEPTWREWLTVPIVLVLVNLNEWSVHRNILHRRTWPLESSSGGTRPSTTSSSSATTWRCGPRGSSAWC